MDDFSQLQDDQWYKSNRDPSHALVKRDRLHLEQRLKHCNMVYRQLQGEAHRNNQKQTHVGEHAYLPNCTLLVPCTEGAQQTGDHQGGKGGIAGLLKTVADYIEFITKHAESNDGGQKASEQG